MRRLVKAGANQIRVVSTSAGGGNNALDVGLDGVRRERPLPRTPERSASAAPTAPEIAPSLRAAFERARAAFAGLPLDEAPPDPAIPERLRVRDSQDRFRKALDAAFDEMTAEALEEALRSPIPYGRFLAAQSLARRGAAGRRRAVAGLQDSDWRVRAACCNALAALGREGASDDATIAELTARLADDSAWVRLRAVEALGPSARRMRPPQRPWPGCPWIRTVGFGRRR